MTSYEKFFEEVISKFPKFKVGMRFETLTSIYPKGQRITEAVAFCSKDKKNMKNLNEYMKTKKLKGDILIIKEIRDKVAICENTNNNKLIEITYKDILESNVKPIQRLRKQKL